MQILDTTCSAYIISVARVLEMAFIGFVFCYMQELPELLYTGEDLTKLRFINSLSLMALLSNLKLSSVQGTHHLDLFPGFQ